MEKGAFNTSFKTGKDFTTWLEAAEKEHASLMQEAGFMAKK
jgi:hypothetical protein